MRIATRNFAERDLGLVLISSSEATMVLLTFHLNVGLNSVFVIQGKYLEPDCLGLALSLINSFTIASSRE